MCVRKKTKSKMAAAPAFWNRRGILAVYQTASNTTSCEDGIEIEDIVNTVKRLGAVHHKLKQPQLWAEVSVINALIYKHNNQHRKEKYFQGLKKVVKCLNRLEEVGIFGKVADVRNKFPRLSKHGGLGVEKKSSYPTTELIINLLGYLTGAAQLLLQVMSSCMETFQHSCAQMASGFFLTFHMTCSSSLSRIWVLARSFFEDIAVCYDIFYPWLNYHTDPQQIETSDIKELPRSLKTWIDDLTAGQHRKNRAAPPGTLDKLFATKLKPEESSPRLFTLEGESLMEASSDLGGSFIPDEVNRPLKTSGIPSTCTDESFVLQRKLFVDNSETIEKLQELAENCSRTSDATHAKKRSSESTNDKNLPNTTITKKQKLDTSIKASFKNSQGIFSHCKKIHIYSNYRWKLCVERTKRKKLMESSKEKMKNITQQNCRKYEVKSKKRLSKNTVDNKSQNTKSSKYSNISNNFSMLQNGNLGVAVRKENTAFDDHFVQNEMSLLSGKFKHLQSFKAQRITSDNAELNDEIDKIFNLLEDN